MIKSTNSVTLDMFSEQELEDKKRPESAATSFKQSLGQLMVILMSKEPSYVRCIKPNNSKRPGIFSESVVVHQVSIFYKTKSFTSVSVMVIVIVLQLLASSL